MRIVKPFFGTKKAMRRAGFVLFGMALLQMVALLCEIFLDLPWLKSATKVSSTALVTATIFSMVIGSLEAKYWRWRSWRSPWKFKDKHGDLTVEIEEMMVGRKWYTLSPALAEWCRDHCKGTVGVQPWIGGYEKGSPNSTLRTIWFSDGDDAFHFKMRWT